MNRLVLLLVALLTLSCVAQDKTMQPPDFKLVFPDVPELQSFIDDYKKKITDEVMEQYNEAAEEGAIYHQWSLDMEGRVTYQGKFWVMMVQGYDYRGGAHGIPYMDALYFDGESKKQVTQSEILRPEAYEKLCELCRVGLMKQGFAADDDWMLRGTQAKAENYQLVVPREEGVEVMFQSYQVAPYAAGVPTVTLPWSEVESLFQDEYRK